jgi:hypothetical protein
VSSIKERSWFIAWAADKADRQAGRREPDRINKEQLTPFALGPWPHFALTYVIIVTTNKCSMLRNEPASNIALN